MRAHRDGWPLPRPVSVTGARFDGLDLDAVPCTNRPLPEPWRPALNVVVTVTFNAVRHGILEPFLRCIGEQNDPDFILLVIDNASTDGTRDYLRGLDLSGVRVILNDRNIGFAAACNQGIAYAREHGADTVTFLNNDTEFDPDLLGGMVASLAASGAAGLSPLITFYDRPGHVWFARGSFPWARGLTAHHDWLGQHRSRLPAGRWLPTAFAPGCCLIFRMDVFDVVPGFDERYFVYWEDADLCRTLAAHGLRVVVDPALECRHKVSVSTEGGFSDFTLHHYSRGHVIFATKHFGMLAMAYVITLDGARTAANILRGLLRPRQFPVWFRGTMSGLRDRRQRRAAARTA